MKSTSRRTLAVVSIFAVALMGCEVVILPPGPGGSFDEDFALATAFGDNGAIQIDWRNGKITVRIDPDAAEITANGTKTVTAGSDNLAEAAMQSFEIRLFQEVTAPSRLILQFDAPEFEVGTVYSADVEVVLPAGLELIVDHLNGDVTVTDNTEKTDITLTNGDVTVAGNAGTTGVALANGEVAVTGQDGDTIVDVNNGNVQVSSNSGNVDVVVNAGSISVEASPADDGEVIARTNVGSVVIAVDADTPASLELRGTIGSVSAVWDDFNVTEIAMTPTGGITATLNGGGGRIVGQTDVGSVEFRAR